MDPVSVVQISTISLGLVPVTMGLVQILKLWIADSRVYPVASVLFSVGLAFIVPQATTGLTVLQGLLIGLVASGLYSGVLAYFPRNQG